MYDISYQQLIKSQRRQPGARSSRQSTCLHAVLLAGVELVQHKAANLHKEPQRKDEHEGQQLAQGLVEEHRPAINPVLQETGSWKY